MGSTLSGDGSRQQNGAPQNVTSASSSTTSEIVTDSKLAYDSTGETGLPATNLNNNNNNNSYDLGGQSTPAPIDYGDQVGSSVISSIIDGMNGTITNSNTTTTSTAPQDSKEFSVTLFGYILYPFRWVTLSSMASWLGPLSSLAMIIGCVMPYVPQYKTIYKTRSCAGFSTFVCLTLLLANILRIAFWFGHRFEIPLLIQSIIMILAQILLLELCVRVKRQGGTLTDKRTLLFKFNPRWFWRWTDLASYLEFLLLISALLGLGVYFFKDSEPFIETLGYCALVIESQLGLPQVIRNYKNRSVQGMSLSMVLMWLGGDAFKTGYFISNKVPYQFWLCGLLQITIDLLILCQVCLYRQNAPIKKGGKMFHQRGDPDSPKEMASL